MRLTCIECAREEQPGDHGWVAVPMQDDETGETILIAYCAGCALREFGDDPP